MEVEAVGAEVKSLLREYLGGMKNKARKVGGYGTLAALGGAAAYLLIGLYAPEPTTLCASAGSPGGFTKCEESQACEYILQGKPAQIKFDYDNWTQQYNMVCENAGKRQFAKSLFLFVSYCAAGLLISLTELFGIKKLVTLTALLAIGGTGIGTFVDDYTMKLAGFGLAHSTFYVFSSLFTIAFSELLPSESPFHSCGITTSLLLFGMCGILYSALSRSVTTSPTVLAWITLVTTVITSFLPAIVMPESPFFLLRQKQTPELCQVIKDIRATNSFCEESDHSLLLQIESLAEKRSLLTSIDQARKSFEKDKPVLPGERTQPGTSPNQVVLTVVVLWVAISVGVTVFHLQTLSLLGVGSEVSPHHTLVLYVVGTLWLAVYALGRTFATARSWMIVYQSLIVFGGVLLVVFGKMGLLEGQNTGQKLLNLFITVGIIGVPSFMIFAPTFAHLSELFPEQIVGTASSLVLLISNIIGSTTPQLASYSKEHTPHFAILCSLLTILPLITLSFHKDSK